MEVSKTYYLIPETDERYEPLLKKYGQVLQTLEANPKKKFNLTVNPHVVSGLDNSLLAELLAVAEHRAVWIKRLVLGISTRFKKSSEGEEVFKDDEWVLEPAVRSWWRYIGATLPFAIFFLHRWEARLMTVSGDLFNDESTPITQRDETYGEIEFTAQQMETVTHRIGEGCKFFLHYCLGTGFDPKPAVEALIAEFGVWFDYDLVYSEYEKSLTSKFYYRLDIQDMPSEN